MTADTYLQIVKVFVSLKKLNIQNFANRKGAYDIGGGI